MTWWEWLLRWWWWRGVAWWHDDGRYLFDGSSSLQDLDHLSGYCTPSMIRQIGQFPSDLHKGILDGIGWLFNKLDKHLFIGGRRIKIFHGVHATIKSFRPLELEMNISCGCLLSYLIFRLFLFSPIISHLSKLFHFNSGEVYPQTQIKVPPCGGVLIYQFYLLLLKCHHKSILHIVNREDSSLSHRVIWVQTLFCPSRM